MPPSLGYINGPLVIPQTAQVRLLWNLPNGKQASNVLHAIVPDGYQWTQDDVNDVFNGIAASVGWGELNPFLPNETLLDTIEIKDLREPNLAGVVDSAAAIAGTSTADALPEGVAFVVSLRTAKAGRSFRGRVYLGGFAENACGPDGRADVLVPGACASFVESVRDAMTAKNFELAVAHRGHAEYLSPATGRLVPAEAPGSVPVTSVTWENAVFDSQRRRK